MKLKLCGDEDSRPRIYWFEHENGTDAGDPFFMGEIEEQIEAVKKFGFTVINPNEFD